jgi:hypothetical protein
MSKALHFCSWLIAIRVPTRVANVNKIFMRQKIDDCTSNRQATKARVKHSNWLHHSENRLEPGAREYGRIVLDAAILHASERILVNSEAN